MQTPVVTRKGECKYRAARYVAAGRCADETFLLNKLTGKYYKLDDVGSEVWAMLGAPLRLTEILGELSCIYEVPSENLVNDVTSLLTTLIGYRVVEVVSLNATPDVTTRLKEHHATAGLESVPQFDRGPNVLWCIAQFALVRLLLRVCGFGRTVARFDRTRGSQLPTAMADDALVEHVAQRVAIAAAFFPGRARCLEQSLILHHELSKRGADSRIRFGVNPYPFSAHAWVEVGRQPVREVSEYLTLITCLES